MGVQNSVQGAFSQRPRQPNKACNTLTQIYVSECLRPLTPRTACPGQVTVDAFEQTLQAFAILCAAFFHFRRVTLQVVEQRDANPPRQPPLFQY